jgi:hypothetical protein
MAVQAHEGMSSPCSSTNRQPTYEKLTSCGHQKGGSDERGCGYHYLQTDLREGLGSEGIETHVGLTRKGFGCSRIITQTPTNPSPYIPCC